MAKFKLTEGDIGRLRKEARSIVGGEDLGDFSQIPIADLLAFGTEDQVEGQTLANIESSLIGQGLPSKATNIEQLARQATSEKTKLEDIFKKGGQPPLAPELLPEVDSPGIDVLGGLFGSITKALGGEAGVEFKPEQLQELLPSRVESAITPKKKSFEEMTEGEIQTIAQFVRAVGSKAKNKKQFDAKIGADKEMVDGFIDFLKERKKSKERPANAVGIAEDEGGNKFFVDAEGNAISQVK